MKHKLLRWLGLFLLVLIAAFFLYTGRYYHAEEAALASLDGNASVTVEHTGRIWRFDGAGEDTALIFYPGGKVEASAYAPMLLSLAEGGVDAFLVEMPFRLAFFDSNAADTVMERYPYARYCLAGHSLGGVAASMYAADHTDTVEALILLAAYPTRALGDRERLLSVYGSEDGVLNLDAYEKAKALWPQAAEELVIPGGNHAGFGTYGEQAGDGTALIPGARQQQETVEAILRFLT